MASENLLYCARVWTDFMTLYLSFSEIVSIHFVWKRAARTFCQTSPLVYHKRRQIFFIMYIMHNVCVHFKSTENVTCNCTCNSPTNAKKIFRAPSIKSMRLKSTFCICLSLSPCCLCFFLCICRKGYLIDHHRPNSRKNVPGSACPLKLAILPLKKQTKKQSRMKKYINIYLKAKI